MPVQKFRTLEEASRALVRHDEDDARLAARVAALWAFSARLTPPLGFRGVAKYPSIEEADADRQRMVVARTR
jgi:hypothetical protein